MPMPLEGIRILDLTTWQNGSGGPALLADLGAEVIKIEDPVNGDPARNVRMSQKEVERGLHSLFEPMNRNKRGMTLNLKSDEGRKVLYKMAESADVLAENFRVGVPERLGIDYATLSKYNPRIIVASASGLGRKGPDAQVGLFDIMGHARSGLLDLLADHDQPLRYVGPWGLADQTGAIMFGFAILAALAARNLHGIGQQVEVSQLASVMTLQTLAIQTYLFSGDLPRTLNRKKAGNPLFTIYRAQDGKWLCLACAQGDRYWPDLCDVIGRKDLQSDPRFCEIGVRGQHAEELIVVLDRVFATRRRDEWVEALTARGVLCTPVQDYDDLVKDPQVLENELLIDVDHPIVGRIREPGVPVKFGKTQPRFRYVSPEFGQHTEEILLEYGFGWDDIERLRAQGVV